MIRKADYSSWEKNIKEFYSYNGAMTLAVFCKDKNMTKSQFHYYKKKTNINKKGIILLTVTLNQDNNIKIQDISLKHEIKITIGDAKISIPTSKTLLISSIIKELMKKC